MKFYFTPGSCSTGIHILLEEIGLLFEAYPVNLIKGEQRSPEFLAINPKGTIPVLVLPDGSALTDFISIAWWLAKTHPRAGLLPQGLEAEMAVLERVNYVVNTVHGQGFTRIFTTENYIFNGTVDADDSERIKAQGHDIVESGLALLAKQIEVEQIGAQPSEPGFSIADAALFYVEFWADKTGIALPGACAAHFQRLLQRPAVRQVLMEEGYHSTLSRQQHALEESTDAIA